jgi:hypothetical protein
MGTNNIECPEGYTKRKGYTRKFRSTVKNSGYTVRRKGKLYTVRPKVQYVTVPASCVKKQNSTVKRIGKLRKGDLIKYGYQYRLSDLSREKALVKAVAAYGAISVYHKLDAIAKLSVTHAPDASKIFAKDRDWVRLQYLKRNK